jgi:hypothetical protein
VGQDGGEPASSSYLKDAHQWALQLNDMKPTERGDFRIAIIVESGLARRHLMMGTEMPPALPEVLGRC